MIIYCYFHPNSIIYMYKNRLLAKMPKAIMFLYKALMLKLIVQGKNIFRNFRQEVHDIRLPSSSFIHQVLINCIDLNSWTYQPQSINHLGYKKSNRRSRCRPVLQQWRAKKKNNNHKKRKNHYCDIEDWE